MNLKAVTCCQKICHKNKTCCCQTRQLLLQLETCPIYKTQTLYYIISQECYLYIFTDRKHWIHLYFLIERNSKLRSGSSREPLVVLWREYAGGLDSDPELILCELDNRPRLVTKRLERPSANSPEELSLLLLVMTALFEELPFREVCPFSESASCTINRINKNRHNYKLVCKAYEKPKIFHTHTHIIKFEH